MSHTEGYSRRRLLTLAAGVSAVFTFDRALATTTTSATTGGQIMQTRAIPSSAESLPIVGLGTYRGFDVGPGDPAYRQLPAVLDELFTKGGTLIDSSPMYGRAEQTTGELLSIHEPRSPAFLATKVWTRGRAEGIRQMEESLRRLQVERLDLMQIHNLVDWQTQLATLRDWKGAGRVRYLGVTHYTAGAYDALETVMRAEALAAEVAQKEAAEAAAKAAAAEAAAAEAAETTPEA